MKGDKALLSELKELQAWATGTAERATRLIKKMEGVSTPSIARKGPSMKEVSSVLAKRRKTAFK